ncbi:MAG: Ig-like domain-containing protein, partial [Candidatus Caldatribacteriota bacterium]
TIIFAIDNSELGDLSSTSETTDSDGNVSTTLTMNFAGAIVVTASWEAADGTIVSDTVSVLCRNHSLYVTANPLTIAEGNSTTITAELTNADGYLVEGENINFIIKDGNGNLSSNSGTTNELGVTSVTLNIDIAGTTTVEANWQGDSTVVLDFVEVICTSAPIYQVNLTADKTTISVGETLDIKATVTENGNPVSGIEVEFSLDDYSNARIDGSDSPVIKTTDGNGETTVVLSNLTAGDSVTVTAEAGGDSGIINISCEAPPIAIELINNSQEHGTGKDGKKQVYFNINVLNSSIDLEQMIISWVPNGNEKLSELWIGDTQVYYNSSGAENGTTITFNQLNNPTYYILNKDESYEIKMIFDKDVKKKDWTIAFINPETLTEITPNITFYLN